MIHTFNSYQSAIKIALIMLTVLVAGCANRRLETYHELRSTEVQPPVYYYTEVEKKVSNTESDPDVESDRFLSEVEAKILKYQKQWQAQLESETPMPNLFFDLSTDAMKAYREVAASPEEARVRLAGTYYVGTPCGAWIRVEPGVEICP